MNSRQNCAWQNVKNLPDEGTENNEGCQQENGRDSKEIFGMNGWVVFVLPIVGE